jgi:hypothetical protein
MYSLSDVPPLTHSHAAAELKILLAQRFMEAVLPDAAENAKHGGQPHDMRSDAAPPLLSVEEEVAHLRAEHLAKIERLEADLAAANERSKCLELVWKIRVATQDKIVTDIAAGISDPSMAAALMALLHSADDEGVTLPVTA